MATITLRPNAAGDLTELTPYPSGPNYNNVNDAVPNDGTYNYQSSLTVKKTDLYNIDALGVGASSISQIEIFVRSKCDASNDGINIKLKTGGTEYPSSHFNIGTSWEVNSWVRATNPKTSLAWTVSDINSLQIGIYCWLILFSEVGELRNSDIHVVVTYVPLDPPTVTTQAVSDILSTTATGNGNITATGGENATRRGFCYMEGDSGDPDTGDSVAYDDGTFGTGAYTKGLTGLSPGTTYRVRAYAVNTAGTGYGTTVQFTTDKVAPTVTTQDATDITHNTATGNGNITTLGGENATERGFEYGYTQTATWSKKEEGSYGIGAFELTIDELQANTEYWYRAYAVNSIGTGYGEWVQFQTPYGVMAEFLKTPKIVILPTLENIEEEEKKSFENDNQVFSELVTAIYSDLSWLHQRIKDLGG